MRQLIASQAPPSFQFMTELLGTLYGHVLGHNGVRKVFAVGIEMCTPSLWRHRWPNGDVVVAIGGGGCSVVVVVVVHGWAVVVVVVVVAALVITHL